MKTSVKSPLVWWPVLLGLVLAVVATVLFFFPWDLLRGPLNRYVSDMTGRKFEITQRLDVRLGLTTRVIAEGIEFANPVWARDPYLLKAEAAQFDVKLWPLLRGKLELPIVSLRKPQLSLQLEPDGKRTWALGKDTSDQSTVPEIGLLQVDKGTLHYVASTQGADITVDFAIDNSSSALPLSYNARGMLKKLAFRAQGRTGSVLQLSSAVQQPFPVEVVATAGRTAMKATGTIANLATFAGVDATFDIHGQSLAELYTLLGVVLPRTPPYALRGNLRKQGAVWAASKMHGRLGKSDLSGDMTYDRAGAIPMLSGKLLSKELDFYDLGPSIGASAAQGSTVAIPVAKPNRKVLPNDTLDFERLKVMNADVWYNAADIRHVKALPLDKMSVHVQLANGVLQMDPLNLGVAGGQLVGKIRIDANSAPATVSVQLEARSLQLNQLFPTIELTKGSLGKLHGKVDLQGRGNSTAQVLGSASGSVAMLMGKGQLSNMLLEVLGLDGGEIIKFLVKGDRNVLLRCAAAAFEVKKGLMTSRSIVLDTSDTVIDGSGQISLADETLDIVLKPTPKDRSILSLRSPLKISGTFAAPSAGPDKGALAGRVGIALALGAINPLLALAATVETGPGKDADCERVLAQATSTGRQSKSSR